MKNLFSCISSERIDGSMDRFKFCVQMKIQRKRKILNMFFGGVWSAVPGYAPMLHVSGTERHFKLSLIVARIKRFLFSHNFHGSKDIYLC